MRCFADESVADLRRWVLSGVIVLLAHCGVAAAMVSWHEPVESDDISGGFAIEVAAVPVAPSLQPEMLAPGPLTQPSPASAAVPVESQEEKAEDTPQPLTEAKLNEKLDTTEQQQTLEPPPPDLTPAPQPEVALAVQPPPEQQKHDAPAPREASLPVVATAPVVLPEEQAPITAAPKEARPDPSASSEVQAWNRRISTLIQRNLRYPAEADRRGQTGTAQVTFSLDHEGRLLASRIQTSAGSALLDAEALAVLQRSQPFPPPPRELPEGTALRLPITFLPPGGARNAKR